MKKILLQLVFFSLLASSMILLVYLLVTMESSQTLSNTKKVEDNDPLQAYSKDLSIRHYDKQGQYTYTLKAEQSLQWQASTAVYLVNPWFKAPPSGNNLHWYITAKYALAYPPLGKKIGFKWKRWKPD